MSTQNVAVVGYGLAGRDFHSYLIGATPGLRLHGVASRNTETREQIVREKSCRAYSSIDEVIGDDEVDLVVLATPNHLHADYAIRAMRAGKHVVTDKPMCLNLDECDRMIEVSISNDRLLNVFQNRRWDGDYLTVGNLIETGQLGKVNWIEMAWQRWDPPRTWRGQASAGGGRLYDLGAHLIDQMLLLIPQPVESVFCRTQYKLPGYDVESMALVVITFKNGAVGVCDLSSRSAIPKPRFHVFGSRATFVKFGLDPQEAAMKAGNIDGSVEPEEAYGRLHDGEQGKVIPTLPGRWRSYYENIAKVLTEEAEPTVEVEETRRVMAIFDAAFLSARENRVVEVENDELK